MIVNEDYIFVTNLGQEGLLLEDISLEIKAPSATEFMPVDLEEEDFDEAELGYYNLKVPKDMICETGTYIFKVDGYETEFFEERECLPKPLSSSPAPDVCIVTGNIRNVAGQAEVFDNVRITAQPVKLPGVYGGSLTLGRRVDTRSDFDGFFSIPVIRGAEVRFEIKDAGVRFQAIVPDQDTIRIEDLIP